MHAKHQTSKHLLSHCRYCKYVSIAIKMSCTSLYVHFEIDICIAIRLVSAGFLLNVGQFFKNGEIRCNVASTHFTLPILTYLGEITRVFAPLGMNIPDLFSSIYNNRTLFKKCIPIFPIQICIEF